MNFTFQFKILKWDAVQFKAQLARATVLLLIHKYGNPFMKCGH